jgi:trans-aconitate 2-methyltransferase
MSEHRYAFGDTEAAAERLAMVAQVFAPPSRAVLHELTGQRFDLAIDLGCGPGHSSQLIADQLAPKQLVGLDLSENYLELARARGLSHTRWYRHDVTRLPLPHAPADLIYARLVLAHLSEPTTVLRGWLSQLRPGGYLVVEEDEEILTETPVLVDYEVMSTTLISDRGGDLYVGRLLPEMVPRPYELAASRRYVHAVPDPIAARLFAMNFRVWRNDPLVRARYSSSELDGLARGLDALAASQTTEALTFIIRQVIVRAPAEERS